MKHNQYVKIYTGRCYDVECMINQHLQGEANIGLRIASIDTKIIDPQRETVCVTVTYEYCLLNMADDADEFGYLITKLEQYAKEELNAHNNCVAEDLQAAADKLKEMGERK